MGRLRGACAPSQSQLHTNTTNHHSPASCPADPTKHMRLPRFWRHRPFLRMAPSTHMRETTIDRPYGKCNRPNGRINRPLVHPMGGSTDPQSTEWKGQSTLYPLTQSTTCFPCLMEPRRTISCACQGQATLDRSSHQGRHHVAATQCLAATPSRQHPRLTDHLSRPATSRPQHHSPQRPRAQPLPHQRPPQSPPQRGVVEVSSRRCQRQRRRSSCLL
mmetsp:Transcript_26926/g.60823  ORF Transcript_26926/g.60823 Transcript_26926/m.60823 type:complete len:217 (+) Transcript_26926:733-1383(+)